MNKLALIPILMFFIACNEPSETDPKVILKKAREKCNEIQNGTYNMTVYMKFMTEKDTLKHTINCNFKKLKDDTLFSKAFHYTGWWGGESRIDELYTGRELVSIGKDSSAEITSCSRWAQDIQAISLNYLFFSPATDQNGILHAHDTDLIKNSNTYKFVGEEHLNDKLTYHIQINQTPGKGEDPEMRTIRAEYHYWINKSDFVPLQYTILYDVIMQGDTVTQFDKYVLTEYEFNNLKDETTLTLASIPSYCSLKEYNGYVEALPLPADTVAPAWELPSLTNQNVSLKSLGGNLVLVDFFYKGCYPCMKMLPVLQTLSEKYKARGLSVIGINPYDKKEDNIAAFLQKSGVTYTVLLGGEAAAKAYRVQGYPTVYFVDERGKIIARHVGFGEETEKELEELILKNLPRGTR